MTFGDGKSSEHSCYLVMELKSGSAPLAYLFPYSDVLGSTSIDLVDIIYPAGRDVTPAYRSDTDHHEHPLEKIGPWLRVLNDAPTIAEGMSFPHSHSPIS